MAAGASLAFMGLVYYVVPLIFQREFPLRKLARWQPYVFAGGITLMAVSMSFAGSYGVPRRHYDIEFKGSQFAAGFDSAAHFMMGLVGVGAVLAFTGLLIFIGLTVWAVFFGKSNAGKPMAAW